MTLLTDTSTFTDRAIRANADRVAHAAAAAGRPHAVDHDLVVAWQGDRGWFTNVAVVLAQPADWDAVLARIAEVVPAGTPVTLISPYAVPDLTASGWELIGHPPLMVRPDGAPGRGARPQPELTIIEVSDRDALEVFERSLVDFYPMTDMQPYRWGCFLDSRVLGGATRFFVGTVAGRPVGTAGAHVACGVNVVDFISTAPERGAGATAKPSRGQPRSPIRRNLPC